jgi:hypothetical protein
MSTHQGPRITRDEAERLLASGVGPEALAGLLAAAIPPVAEVELVGEAGAVMGFRAAHLANVPSRRKALVLRAAFSNLLAAKIAAAAAVAAAATGGMAIAAATGNLPGPLHDSTPRVDAATAAAHSSAAASAAASTSAESSSAPAEPSESEAPGSSATPHPSLDGLCKAFRAGATDNPGKAISNPAFSVLVAKAGGVDNVAAYCDTRIAPAAKHHHHGRPATPGSARTHAANHPSAPVTHPAGEPTVLPPRHP